MSSAWNASIQGHGRVETVSSLEQFEKLLGSARDKCAVAFFTSATCPPCRMVYQPYDELAAEYSGKAVLIKIDVGVARQIGQKYAISATPTFITWSKGDQVEKWSGANPTELKGKVQMLVTMTFPPHPHSLVSMPVTLRSSMKPIVFSRVPPLDKVVVKLGDLAQDLAVVAQMAFLNTLASEGAANVWIPDLSQWAAFMQKTYAKNQVAALFPLVDLLRASLSDPRVSSWFAVEKDHKTIKTMLDRANSTDAPYNVRLVTVQAVCNLFTSPLFPDSILSLPSLRDPVIELVTTSLLDKAHSHLRVAASSLSFNIAAQIQRRRSQEDKEIMIDECLVEMVASLVEALKEEIESKEAVKGLTLSIALSVYCAPLEGEAVHLVKVLEAGKVLRGKATGKDSLGEKALCQEVARLVEA